MSHDEYVDFFEELADSHVDIDGQFLNLDLFDDPDLTAKPSGIDWKDDKFALILPDLEADLGEVNNDQQFWNQRAEFWIVAPTGRDDIARRKLVKHGSLEVAKQVIAKMQELSDAETDPVHWLHWLLDGSFTVNKIGPIWDGCYGWRIGFDLMQPSDLVVDPDKWI